MFNIFDTADYLELKVADIAINSSLHQQTASILGNFDYVREVTAFLPIYTREVTFGR